MAHIILLKILLLLAKFLPFFIVVIIGYLIILISGR